MLTKEQHRKHVLLRLLGHPSIVLPTATGIATVLISAFGIGGGYTAFGGIMLVLSGAGITAWRILFKTAEISKVVLDESNKETEDARKERLRILRRTLASDDDPRDEELLADLLEVESAFRDDRTWMENVPASTATNVLGRVDRVTETSIAMLERAFKLRTTATKLRGDGRNQLLNASDQLLAQVREGIDELGKILAGVSKLSIRRMTGQTLEEGDLKRSLDELQEQLRTAEVAEDARQSVIGDQDDDRKYAEYVK